MTTRDLRDLPVSVALPGVLGREVVAFVEGEAGWQVVTEGGPPEPALALVAEPAVGRPCVVVVDGVPAPAVVRSALLAGAVDVIGWPDERGRLLDAPLRVPSAPRAERGTRVVRLVGAAGGVGTSTVALALAGLLAWSGRRALVVGDDDLLALCGTSPWRGPGAVEVAALDRAQAAAEVGVLAVPVAGVDGLRVLGGGGVVPDDAAGWGADVVVVDGGVRPLPIGAEVDLPDGGAVAAADVVVARPDGCLRRLVGRREPVVVVGDRPLPTAAVGRILGRPPAVVLPWSARVSRAGLAGRVPAGLPGSWLAALRDGLGAVGGGRR